MVYTWYKLKGSHNEHDTNSKGYIHDINSKGHIHIYMIQTQKVTYKHNINTYTEAQLLTCTQYELLFKWLNIHNMKIMEA